MASKLAVQMFTVREFTKTAAEFADSLKKISDIGYEAVQLSACTFVTFGEAHGTITCRDHIITFQHQEIGKDLSDRRLIVDDQNSCDQFIHVRAALCRCFCLKSGTPYTTWTA